MKHVLWVDAVNPPPKSTDIHYYWARGVYCAIDILLKCEYPLKDYGHIEYIDTAYDAGDYRDQGGNYDEFLHFLYCSGRQYPVKIHATDLVEVAKIRKFILDNNWFEVDRDVVNGNFQKYIYNYDSSCPSAYEEKELTSHSGQVCYADSTVVDTFDLLPVLFEDGYQTDVICYELKKV